MHLEKTVRRKRSCIIVSLFFVVLMNSFPFICFILSTSQADVYPFLRHDVTVMVDSVKHQVTYLLILYLLTYSLIPIVTILSSGLLHPETERSLECFTYSQQTRPMRVNSYSKAVTLTQQERHESPEVRNPHLGRE